MKYLILLVLMVSTAQAEWLVKWKGHKNGDEYSIDKPTEEEAFKYLEKVILNSKWLECDWMLTQPGTYAKKVVNGTEVFCKPKNFTVTDPRDLVNDPTPEETAKKNKDLSCAALKEKLKTVDLKLDEFNSLKRCELGL